MRSFRSADTAEKLLKSATSYYQKICHVSEVHCVYCFCLLFSLFTD